MYYQPFNLCQLNSFLKTVPQESFFLHSDEWVWAFFPTWLRPTFSWVLLFLLTCFCFVSLAWKCTFKFIILLSFRSLFLFIFIYFVFGRAGSLSLCVGFLSLPGVRVGGGRSPGAVCGPLIVVASPAVQHGPQGPWTPAAVALGLSSCGAQA